MAEWPSLTAGKISRSPATNQQQTFQISHADAETFANNLWSKNYLVKTWMHNFQQ